MPSPGSTHMDLGAEWSEPRPRLTVRREDRPRKPPVPAVTFEVRTEPCPCSPHDWGRVPGPHQLLCCHSKDARQPNKPRPRQQVWKFHPAAPGRQGWGAGGHLWSHYETSFLIGIEYFLKSLLQKSNKTPSPKNKAKNAATSLKTYIQVSCFLWAFFFLFSILIFFFGFLILLLFS